MKTIVTFLFIFLATFLVFCNSKNNQINYFKKEKLKYNNDSLLKRIDSIIETRINYFSIQFGGRENMENFYGKSIDSIRSEYRKIYLDSLIKKNE